MNNQILYEFASNGQLEDLYKYIIQNCIHVKNEFLLNGLNDYAKDLIQRDKEKYLKDKLRIKWYDLLKSFDLRKFSYLRHSINIIKDYYKEQLEHDLAGMTFNGKLDYFLEKTDRIIVNKPEYINLTNSIYNAKCIITKDTLIHESQLYKDVVDIIIKYINKELM